MPDAPYRCPKCPPDTPRPFSRPAPPEDFDKIIEDWQHRVMWYQDYSRHLDRNGGCWLFLAVLFAQIAALLAVYIARWPYWAYLAVMAAVASAFAGIARVLRPTQYDRDGWGK